MRRTPTYSLAGRHGVGEVSLLLLVHQRVIEVVRIVDRHPDGRGAEALAQFVGVEEHLAVAADALADQPVEQDGRARGAQIPVAGDPSRVCAAELQHPVDVADKARTLTGQSQTRGSDPQLLLDGLDGHVRSSPRRCGHIPSPSTVIFPSRGSDQDKAEGRGSRGGAEKDAQYVRGVETAGVGTFVDRSDDAEVE